MSNWKKDAFIEGLYKLVNPYRESPFEFLNVEDFDIITEEDFDKLVWSGVRDDIYRAIIEYERRKQANSENKRESAATC